MNKPAYLRNVFFMFLCISCMTAKAEDLTIDFAEGKWDKAKWQTVKCFPVKPIDSLKDFDFTQKKDCISYDCSAEDIKRGDDNCLLIYDTGKTDVEFEVVFESGKGHPGIVISPEIENGVITKGYCVFIANYIIAAWYIDADPAIKSAKYANLVQIARWQPEFQKHKITVRYNKIGFVMKVDDSDSIVLRPKWEYGLTPLNGFKVNSKIGIWACHGLCSFYSLTIKEKPSLLFQAVDPSLKK